MKPEKPVQVIPSKSRKHKTEQRVFARNIRETYCVQKGCKFYGKHAAQGVCHTTKPFEDGLDWKYIDKILSAGDEHLKEIKKMCKATGKGPRYYVSYLEGMVATAWCNSIFTLDELIRLRRENALLKVRSKARRSAPKGKAA